jgi:pilus assembly protein Flp/PilA
MKNLIARFVREEEGQDLIEYALLAGFISLVVVGGVTLVGTSLTTLYTNVSTEVDTAAGAVAAP